MSMILPPLLGAFAVLTIVAALKDVTSLTIPNWLCATLAVLFLPAGLAAGLPLEAWGVHLGVGFAALAIGAGMFAMRWLGGGDAKLLAACALWLGWPATGSFLMWTVLGGGVLALLLLTARRLAPALAGLAPAWANRLLTGEAAVPYGVAIAFGALMALPATDIFSRL